MRSPLAYLAKNFLIIGCTSFGGYMALVAMVREKLVSRDKVIGDEIITEGIALASVLPGPVAVNVAAYVGYGLAGTLGALISVVAVLIPSFVMMLAFAALYFSYSEHVQMEAILAWIVPVVIALLVTVAVHMGQRNVKSGFDMLLVIGGAVMLIVFPGYETGLLVLGVAALAGILFRKKPGVASEAAFKPVNSRYLVVAVAVFLIIFACSRFFMTGSIVARLFSEFASVSLTLFGGGYVMVPMLKSTLVDQTQWFSMDEFMTGISAGQVTPGPILISAAFFGYKLDGITGAFVATVAIFFPSSVLMILVSKYFTAIKFNRFVQSALAGVRPAIAGLILAAAYSIYSGFWNVINPVISFTVAVISFVLFYRYNFNPAIVVLSAAIGGYLVYLW